MIADDLKELLGHRLPGDHARQTLAHDMVAGAMAGVSALLFCGQIAFTARRPR